MGNQSKKTVAGPLFDHVEEAPPDAIFLVKQKYDADPSPDKIDVGIGAYRDDNGKPYVLPVVRKVEKMMLDDQNENKEYLSIQGSAKFIDSTRSFAFGKESAGVKAARIATVQTLSGTGALRVGMDFIKQALGTRDVYISNPTWGNHKDICFRAGLTHKTYRYWRQATRDLDFEGMCEDLKGAEEGSVVVLHMCAHNPTGVDMTHSQWEELLELFKSRSLIPFFDAAYQGFASGDVLEDAFGLRLFESSGLELFLAQSYSKNMGLYGERVGALSVVCKTAPSSTAVCSHLKKIIRAMYSNPPRHGSAIVGTILSDEALYAEWLVQLKGMTDRIKAMREGLRKELEELGAPGDWSFITTQIGMFSYTGLSKDQVDRLINEFHIYMPGTGRISIAGLTPSRLKYFAKAVYSVL